MEENKRVVGNSFEEKAQNYLENLGFQIVFKNFYTPYGELDLVMKKDNLLSIVEVKYRKKTDISIFQSITKNKLKNIEKSIRFLLTKYPKYGYFDIRVDACLIEDENSVLTYHIVENILGDF
ncbi:YraN family protein [bacterium]|nr:YraN family protein [bacterium]